MKKYSIENYIKRSQKVNQNQNQNVYSNSQIKIKNVCSLDYDSNID